VSDFEESLLALDAKLDEAKKLGKAVVAAIGLIGLRSEWAGSAI